MYRLRTTKTKSKATAVQVVQYSNRKTVVLKHIGSTKDKKELTLLKISAKNWIKSHDPQQRLFTQRVHSSRTPKKPSSSQVLVLNQVELISTHSTFTYQILTLILSKLGFTNLLKNSPNRQLLLDLVIARLIKPVSKLESVNFLRQEFNINYSRSYVYRELKEYTALKDKVEQLVVNVAKKHFSFNFKLIYYDVSTLYFESFKSDDELKQCGFSKDHKFNQPRIVIGLVVNDQGFPVSYQIFKGNKFEGHTFIPVIEKLQQKHAIKTLTIVADAAMISQQNIDQLKRKKLTYIVGARVGNLSQKVIKQISTALKQQDQVAIRLKTKRGELICQFSQSRHYKDKSETTKQVTKAKNTLEKNPEKASKRLKFIKKSKDKEKLEFNQKLLDKTKLLWGIKGYYTNLKEIEISNQEVINQYRQLWKVEKAFRITKSDLQARPIYLRNTDTIKAHLLICFLALSVAKYMEIKSGLSLNKAIQLLQTVKDAKIKNKLTNEVVTLTSSPSSDVDNFIQKLGF
ncbi:MAG: IS1634 family transposase [Candidatus Beckwithbacteria bacterium]